VGRHRQGRAVLTDNLSLYQIKTELLDLMRYRESISQDSEPTAEEWAASLEAVDKQIAEYAMREVGKVDGIAGYLRECWTRAKVLKDEATRISDQSDMWTLRGEYLEAITLRVMLQTGATLLEGRTSTFKIRKNPPSVEVAQPELVPKSYMRSRVSISQDLWDRLMEHLMRTDHGGVLLAELTLADRSDAAPMKEQIRYELKAGVSVPGCRLVDDKVRLVVE
jgi:Siphovirus Gp157